MSKGIFVLFLFFCFSSTLIAQKKSELISWDKVLHDFGTYKEEEGIKTAVFTFSNNGNTPISIKNVNVRVRSVSYDWTKETVGPGEKGNVKLSYNPQNRPGKFKIPATIEFEGIEDKIDLEITGEVIARTRGIEDEYPRIFGDLRLKTSHHSFATVYNNQVVVDTVPMINTSENDIIISFQGVPEHISIKTVPEVLKGKKENQTHGEKGNIIITYDGSKVRDWGYKIDRVFLVVNDQRIERNRLSISATIQESFSHLTEEEMANAPKIEFDKIEYDFGTLKSGERISHNFNFKNVGKSDLIIRRIRAACGCTATNPEKMVIKPGETSHITVTFNSRGQTGQQNRTITVISNDPKQHTTILRVKGTVEN